MYDQLTREVFFFGHYDSRGGASFVAAPTLAGACEEYNQAMNGGAPPGHAEFVDMATDDYVERLHLIWYECEPPEKRGELMSDYRHAGDPDSGSFEDGFAMVRLQYRLQQGNEPPEWTDTEYVIVYRPVDKAQKLKGSFPDAPSPKEAGFEDIKYPNGSRLQYRFVDFDPGEDAWGVFWLPPEEKGVSTEPQLNPELEGAFRETLEWAETHRRELSPSKASDAFGIVSNILRGQAQALATSEVVEKWAKEKKGT